MITRGYLIGEIVDMLSDLKTQISTRTRLNMQDITVITENFCRDLLNVVLSLDLTNLNDQRSNEPGLDLGDEKAGVAFQITATKTSAKVQDTIDKITAVQKVKFQEVRVLVLGSKQSTYTVNNQNYPDFKWDRDIWDLDDICRNLMSLDLLKLQKLHELVSGEFGRVKVDLEVPDADGNYETNVDQFFEDEPSLVCGNGEACAAFLNEHYEMSEYTAGQVLEWISDLEKKLEFTPRISRQFLCRLIKGRDRSMDDKHSGVMNYSYERLKRQVRGLNVYDEVMLLANSGLVDARDLGSFVRGEWTYDDGEVQIRFGCYETYYLLCKYAEEKGIPMERLFVVLDFSQF